MNNPQTTYCIRIWDKNDKLMCTRYYKSLEEAKTEYEERCKRLWMEIELIKVYIEDDSCTEETIEKQEIELHL